MNFIRIHTYCIYHRRCGCQIANLIRGGPVEASLWDIHIIFWWCHGGCYKESPTLPVNDIIGLSDSLLGLLTACSLPSVTITISVTIICSYSNQQVAMVTNR